LHRCVKFHDTEYAVYGVTPVADAPRGVVAAAFVFPAECAVGGAAGDADDRG